MTVGVGMIGTGGIAERHASAYAETDGIELVAIADVDASALAAFGDRWGVPHVYAANELPRLPRSLREATDLFEASAFARRAFGDDVVDHYAHFFRTEQAAFDAAVTDWERQRYFERI